jgi:hypothetical protein
MTLTDATGQPIERIPAPPSVGHSNSAALTPLTATNGSTSPEGPSIPQKTPFQYFLERQRTMAGRLKKATKQDQLVDRLMGRLDTIHAYLNDEQTMFQKLEEARFKDILAAENMLVERLQQLAGIATPVVAPHQQAKIDEVLPMLMDMMKQRGLTMTATQQKVEFTTTT